MWIKICGITRTTDALAAAQAGADAVGLNFVAGPRRIEPAQADEILGVVPHFVTPVALVRLAEGRIEKSFFQWLIASRIRHLQVYDAPDVDAIDRLSREGFSVFPVIHVSGPQLADAHQSAIARASSAVILDTFAKQQLGGTGRSFTWEWVPQAREAGRLNEWPPIILAGGLNPDNVADAIRRAQPDGVDVSSGVELDDKPGWKDHEKIARFIAVARAAAEE